MVTDILTVGLQGPQGPAALAAGSVVTARGQLVVGDATGTPVALSATGSTGKFLKGGTDPAWANIAESDVTNLVTDLAAKAPTASPTFTGTVTAAAVTATGDVTLGDADSDLTKVRRFRRVSTKPTITATAVGTYPAAGTTPTVSNSGTDGAGAVNVTVGSATGLGAGALCKVNFSSAKPNTNYAVTIQASSSAASNRKFYISNRATDGFTVSIDAPSATDQINFLYTVTEWEEV